MTIKIEKSGGKARFKANDQEFLVADDGNVGIGRDNPSAKLDVRGTVRAFTDENGTALNLSSAGGARANGDLSIKFEGEHALFESAQARDFIFKNNNTDRMRITSNGNVGIGTDNPIEKLHVEGNAILGVYSNGTPNNDRNAGLSVYGNSTGARGVVATFINDEVGSDGKDGAFIHINDTSDLGEEFYGVEIGSKATGVSPNFLNCDMLFRTAHNTLQPIEKMRLTSDGKLGIGTDNPATKLHVEGDATINGVTISSLIARIEALEAGN